MGMLRSGNESELVKTLDYQAEGGTIQVNGQPCTLTKYRVQRQLPDPWVPDANRVHAPQQTDL